MDTGTLGKKGRKNFSFVLWADSGIQKHSEVALTLLAAPRKTWNGREEGGPPAQECAPHGPGPGAPLDQKQHVSWQSFRQQAVIFLSVISRAVYHHNLESPMSNLNSAKLPHSRSAGLSSAMLNKPGRCWSFWVFLAFHCVSLTASVLSHLCCSAPPEGMRKLSAPGWSDKTSRETEAANCTFRCTHTLSGLISKVGVTLWDRETLSAFGSQQLYVHVGFLMIFIWATKFCFCCEGPKSYKFKFFLQGLIIICSTNAQEWTLTYLSPPFSFYSAFYWK